jgi:hypothetical protein
MRTLLLKPTALLLGLLLFSAGEGMAQPLGEFCGRSGFFLNACATLVDVQQTAVNQLTLIVENSSVYPDPNGDVFPTSFIGTIVMKFKDGTVPNNLKATAAVATITTSPWGRSGTLAWKGVNNAGGATGIDWDAKITKDGAASEGIRPGERVAILVTFNENVTKEDLELWAMQLQNIGSEENCQLYEGKGEGECSDWAVVPEPVTMVLLGTGLAGMGGVAALRRRRRGLEIETE